MNALEMQEKLKRENAITVPWLQTTFDLPYGQARGILSQLLTQGWVVRDAGGQFKVCRHHLQLRKIERWESADLIAGVDQNNMLALTYIADKPGISKENLLRDLSDEALLTESLPALQRLQLIYCHNGGYYVRISERAMMVLQEVERTKRRLTRASSLLSEDAKIKDARLRQILDKLFQ